MSYKTKTYEHLYGLPGFSDELLKDHFTLYQGYVKNTNLLIEKIEKLRQENKESSPEYGELKRRFGWEFNGMRLHEYYFDSMKKNAGGEIEESILEEKIDVDFGSFEFWKKDFKATGLMRGIGWVIFAFDPAAERLLNLWVNEHDLGHGAGLAPLLIMDVFEHAYNHDYGLKKEEYVNAFLQIIHWDEVMKRFHDALASISHAHTR